MMNWNRVSDGSGNPPKLTVQQSWWAMLGLGSDGTEWSMEEKFERIAEAGFSGISGFIPPLEEMEKWHRLLDRYKLDFSAIAFPRKGGDLLETFKAARRFGRVQYINSQVMDSFVTGEEALGLLEELLTLSAEARIPHFIETHRGTVTQDLIRTCDYVRRLPELRLTIDLSHYVVAGEMNGTCPQAETHFDELLARTSCIHGRISNGEQVQVDIGPDGDHPIVPAFARWWTKGMSQWKVHALPGDLLPFIPELGPPNYAITHWVKDGRHPEISDRWQQALVLKRMAESLWESLSP